MKLAIVGPSFFGYLDRLAERFHHRGVEADFIDERFANTASAKIFLRYTPQSVRNRAVAAHLRKIGDRIITGGYSHVLIVSPEVVTPELVTRLRDAGLRVTRYGWDSIANKPRMARIDPLVDAIASFDPGDCAAHGFAMIPLYSDTIATGEDPPREIDILYCATVHSDRPGWLRDLMQVCAERGWSHRLMLFYHGRLLWLIRYGWNPTLWRLFPLISTTSFGRAALVDQTRRARIVLDIHHSCQTGLTMRTFEALSLGALVVSTNAQGTATLPETLRRRVIVIENRNLAKAMEKAFAALPLPPLAEADRYALSIDRFVDQLHAFILGPQARTDFKDMS